MSDLRSARLSCTQGTVSLTRAASLHAPRCCRCTSSKYRNEEDDECEQTRKGCPQQELGCDADAEARFRCLCDLRREVRDLRRDFRVHLPRYAMKSLHRVQQAHQEEHVAAESGSNEGRGRKIE